VTRALLDINVLLALLDSDHIDHERARRWLEREVRFGWASCAITENGFVRIISQPRYPSPVPAAQALARLAQAAGTASHEFWPCSVSLLSEQVIERERVLGPGQVTDIYLLALAVEHGGRFATFDQSVPLAAVHGARPEHLSIL
jgi:uncharacterized protein